METNYNEVYKGIKNDGFYQVKVNGCFESPPFEVYKARVPEHIVRYVFKTIEKWKGRVPVEFVYVGCPIGLEGKINHEKNEIILKIKKSIIDKENTDVLIGRKQLTNFYNVLKEQNLYEYYREVYLVFRPMVGHYE